MQTRDRILEEALNLFSQYGYEAVSVARIGQAVGIRAPSLYKHFSSKQEIFDTLLQEANARYTCQAAALCLDGQDPRRDGAAFAAMTPGQLIQTVLELFSFFLHDPWISRFRKMLTLEQYGNPDLARLCSELYYEGPIRFQAELFRQLPQFRGKGEPEQLAICFYSPIYLLLTLCDREPDREPEALERLRAHVEVFSRTYSVSEEMYP